jgi:hypothetical protein
MLSMLLPHRYLVLLAALVVLVLLVPITPARAATPET